MAQPTDPESDSPHGDGAGPAAPPVRQVRLAELPGLVGTSLGSSSQIRIDQRRIDLFAEATEDHQWLHTDPVAAAAGPFGGTIAHGYLTLSLFGPLSWQILDVTDATAVVNYGVNKVRFPAPVPVDSAVSMELQISNVTEIPGGLAVTMIGTFSVPDSDKPVCIAEAILRYHGPTT